MHIIERIELIIIKTVGLLQNSIVESIHFLLWPRKTQYKKPNLIGIVKAGNIGDLLCSIPAIESIRRKYPNATLILISNGGNSLDASYILKDYSTLDGFLIYKLLDVKSISGIKKVSKMISEKHFDRIIYLPNERAKFRNLIRDMILLRMSTNHNVERFLISTVNIFPKVQSKYLKFDREVVRLINLLPKDFDRKIEFNFPISPIDAKRVNNFFEDNNILNKPKLVISMKGKAEVNQWPINSFREIVKLWNETFDSKPLIIGGNDQKAYVDNSFNNLPVINCAGEFSIAQSICLVKEATLLLTVDTGTAHMASVYDSKCIVLSSSYYYPEKWMPYGKNIYPLRSDPKCSPCLKGRCPLGSNQCMSDITVDDVWNMIINLVDSE